MYDDIEARFQTLLQALTGTFATAAQVTRGDWSPFDKGLDLFAVLYPGPFQEGDSYAGGGQDYIWTVNLNLIVRRGQDKQGIVKLAQARDAVVQQIQKYPSLNALTGVTAVGKASGTDFADLRDKSGQLTGFTDTTLSWQVTQESIVTGGEIP